MNRSTWASGSGYVPSDSIGFWVAITRNGSGTGYVVWPIVTWRSCITSSSADCTLAGARLISSASRQTTTRSSIVSCPAITRLISNSACSRRSFTSAGEGTGPLLGSSGTSALLPLTAGEVYTKSRQPKFRMKGYGGDGHRSGCHPRRQRRLDQSEAQSRRGGRDGDGRRLARGGR